MGQLRMRIIEHVKDFDASNLHRRIPRNLFRFGES